MFDWEFWWEFVVIFLVVVVKVVLFDWYCMFEFVCGVVVLGWVDEIVFYMGNDDVIVVDLFLEFYVDFLFGFCMLCFVGGLFG